MDRLTALGKAAATVAAGTVELNDRRMFPSEDREVTEEGI